MTEVVFDTFAAAEGAIGLSTTDTIRTLGYYASMDGGGASYTNVPTEPTFPGYITTSDPTPQYWILAEQEPTPRMFGAKGDASLMNGAWTGRDDKAELQAWEDFCAATNRVRFLGVGKYKTTEAILASPGNRSNTHIKGVNNQDSCIISLNPDGILWSWFGDTDASNSSDIYLTEDVAAGSMSITVNDNSGLLAEQYIVLTERSRGVFGNLANGSCVYISSTSFYVAGDQHCTFIEGTPVQVLGDTLGIITGAATGSTYDGSTNRTTVEVFWLDGAVLTNDTDLVYYCSTSDDALYNPVALSGEVARIQSIGDDGVVNLFERLEFAYKQNSGAPSPTTVRRYTTPCTGILLEDVGIELDTTVTYTHGNGQFQFGQGVGFTARRLRFGNLLTRAFKFTEAINVEVSECSAAVPLHGPEGDTRYNYIYVISLGLGCHNVRILDCHAYGCRHFVTTISPSVNGIEPANALIANCLVEAANTTAFDQHPGARSFFFTGCTALGGSEGSARAGCGFDLRGRLSQVIGFSCVGLSQGIAVTQSDGNQYRQGSIRSCDTSIKINSATNFLCQDVSIVDITNSIIPDPTGASGTAVWINSDIGSGFDAAYPGITLDNVRVYGTPATAAVYVDGTYTDPSWVIGVYAPDASPFQSGTTIPANQIRPGYFDNLFVGTQSETAGQIVLANAAAGNFATTVKSSDSATAAWTFTLPTSAGSNGQLLITDGAGATEWTSTPLLNIPAIADGGISIKLADSLSGSTWAPISLIGNDNVSNPNVIEWNFTSVISGTSPAIGATRPSSSSANISLYATTSDTRYLGLTVKGAGGSGSSAVVEVPGNGAASFPALALTGSVFTGGTGTTTKPQLSVEPSGTTSTGWSTSGTQIGVNAVSGFAGNLLDLQVSGTSKLKVDATGNLTQAGSLTVDAATSVPAGGTTGAGVKFSTTSNLGIFFGSGAPTLSAAQGSLYLRTDGSGTGNRAYVNTNGSTGWTAITTAT